MLIAPANPNSIHVRMVRTGFLKTEFDSTYPIRLNGILSQDEFRESIGNINRRISSNQFSIVCVVIFGLCIISGFSLFIAGGITATSRASGFQILIAVGAGLMIFGSLLLSVGCIGIRYRRTSQMRQAIAEESNKYSTRSPTACSWRLDVTRIWSGYGTRHRTRFVYHLIIDIRHTVASGRGSARIAPQPSAPVQEQDDIPPPPYPGHSARFCSQCGMPRQDLTANFCPSCGQSFHKS